MPYTLSITATGLVFCEASSDWNDAETVPAGMTLTRSIVLDAQGQRLEGPRRIVNGVAVAATPKEDAAERAAFYRREKKRAIKGDKLLVNAVLETVRLAVNKNLPAGSRITKAEMRASWESVIDALTDDEV